MLIKVDVSSIKHLFSREIQHNWHAIASPPHDNVELLTESEVLRLHPVEGENLGTLHILRSHIGSCYILAEPHPSLEACDTNITKAIVLPTT